MRFFFFFWSVINFNLACCLRSIYLFSFCFKTQEITLEAKIFFFGLYGTCVIFMYHSFYFILKQKTIKIFVFKKRNCVGWYFLFFRGLNHKSEFYQFNIFNYTVLCNNNTFMVFQSYKLVPSIEQPFKFNLKRTLLCEYSAIFY